MEGAQVHNQAKQSDNGMTLLFMISELFSILNLMAQL